MSAPARPRPLLLAPSATTRRTERSPMTLDDALAQVQRPPFEAPVVLDLTGYTDASRAELVRALDVLRWRSVWSPAAVVCPPAMRGRLAALGFSPAIPVHDTLAVAWCAVTGDRSRRGPGHRGLAPVGTFGVERTLPVPRGELLRIDALRRARPVIRWP